MGSATVPDKPHVATMSDKPKNPFKSIIKGLFQKKKDKPNPKKTAPKLEVTEPKVELQEPTIEVKEVKIEVKEPKVDVKVAPIEVDLVKTFQKIKIKDKEILEDDELLNFSVSLVNEDKKRTESNSSDESAESGFCEKVDEVEDVVEEFERLGLEKKGKKQQNIVVKRAPIRTKLDELVHPYQHSDQNRRHIHQVNRQSFSGGQIIVNPKTDFNIPSIRLEETEITNAIKKVDQDIADAAQFAPDELLQMADELIAQETEKESESEAIIMLRELLAFQNYDYESVIGAYDSDPASEFGAFKQGPGTYESDPALEFGVYKQSAVEFPNVPETVEEIPNPYIEDSYSIYLTPPHSNPSPISDYSLSPMTSSTNDFEKSSPMRDYEKFEDIQNFLDDTTEKKSSMSMKQFKDMQKDLAAVFAKKECCQTKKSAKSVFQEHLEKLSKDERKGVCVKAAGLDITSAYGVLHNILLNAKDVKNEDIHHALFFFICERFLAEKPDIFLEDYGLSLLKAASLRCHRRPLFTRYLVQCVRVAFKILKKDPVKCIFNEVDSQGDNIVVACARIGDACAVTLAELIAAPDAGVPPMFAVDHANNDGNTALHVACSTHSASSSRLHIIHVLLEHGKADLWTGDKKGQDTALHLAVNSPNCDIQVVMMLFKQVERKQWKKLAHHPNSSHITPLEYARAKLRSSKQQSQKYPHEVLNFLRNKCR